MNSYYNDTLYPLQDKVLKIIDNLETPFYLTGGTALSRCYLHHRYSDDLDLFVNNELNFAKLVEKILINLNKEFKIKVVIRSESYISLMINDQLKVDFVNDVTYKYGELEKQKIYSKVDNLENILSNKLSALISRDEPKDVVDILMIFKKNKVDWKKIFSDVNSKAVGIFPIDVSKRLLDFPVEMIDRIKWVKGIKPEIKSFKAGINELCDSILKV
jgi:predicted nucleotidyltransferase component of viral defense system